MKKRLLSILLTAVLLLSLMPAAVFATDLPTGATAWLVDDGDNHVWYKLEDSNTKLTIGGTGAMPDFNDSNPPWGKNIITTVVIGSGVTSIGNKAFKDSFNLASVTVESTTPPTLGEDEFAGASTNIRIYVPATAVETYKDASNWSLFQDYIEEIPSIGQILPSDFPTNDDSCCHKSNDDTVHLYKDVQESKLIFNCETYTSYEVSLSGLLATGTQNDYWCDETTKASYEYIEEGIKIQFNMTGDNSDELESINVIYCTNAIYEGTYYPPEPVTFKTISDILATVPDFPTSIKQKTWMNDEETDICYLDSSSLMFVGSISLNVTTAASVTMSGDDYEYVDGSGWSAAFKMEDSKLASITVVSGDKTYVYAHKYKINVNLSDSAWESYVNKGTTYAVAGNKLTVGDGDYTATPKEGFEFDCWKIGNATVTGNGTITADTTFTAVFKEKVKTIGDILPDDFPETEATGWVNSAGQKCYIDENNKKFIIGNSEISLDSSLIKNGDNYTYTAPNYDTYTFVMSFGKLVRIEFQPIGPLDIYLPPHVHVEGTGAITFKAWDGGSDHNSMPTTAGSYYLTEDVTLGETWTVEAGSAQSPAVTNLCLNGHVIKLAKEATGSVIKVPQYATLNLYDCGTTKHYFTKNATTGLWTLAADQTIPTDSVVTGGCITGGTGNMVSNGTCGGGVYVSGGAFTLHGGNIIGNKTTGSSNTGYGGGVYVYGGTFTMSGGAILGNYADGGGGGVYINNGTFNIEGGCIDSNYAGGNGGGVYVVKSGTFTMTGDSIIANNKGKWGAGVYFYESEKFLMSGNSKIKGNLGTSNGGGVFSTGTFEMSGNSTISYNKGTNGGGVCFTGTFEMSDNSTIAYNEGTVAGGVYAGNNITLGGSAKITENIAGDTTNNVYLSKDKYIVLGTGSDEPSENMSVGVTTEKTPTAATPVAITTNGTTGDTNYFFSDIPKYYVSFAENHLELKPITITFDSNGGTCTSVSAIVSTEGKLAELPTATRNGYTFNGWYTLASGGENITTSTVFTSDTTIYAQWTEISAPPAPSYDSGSSSSTVTVPVTGDENTVKVSATVSGSTATVNKINDADLAKVSDAEAVEIDLSGVGKNVDTAKIPTETVEKIAEKSSMTVKLPVATVEFDKTATEEIADQAKGESIELVVDDIKEVSLNAVQKESVGKLNTAIIIDAHLVSSGSKLCTSEDGGFGGGKAKIVLPYEIKNNRKPENYSVFYVNDAGKLEKLNAVYDEELKAFVFEIEHFSVYAVAFEQFVDIDANAYYYEAVKWAAAKGITDGTDSTHFSPNGITNRGQMVTFLWRAAGKPEPTITETPFTDLDPDWYYYKAVLWAYENGITDGTSATTFEPNKNVSRAQTVTFLWRYAGKPVLDYWMQMTDVASGKYYTEAVRWALAEGITDGTSKTTFSPNDDCLRGQIVTFLYRDFAE